MVFVDAVYAQTVKFVERTHPFGIALGEVVIDRNDMYTFASKGIEVNRECGNERLTFTRLHFGNITAMQCGTTHELNVVMNH